MSEPAIVDGRDEQRYPKLLPQEIERLRRFGELTRFADGAEIWRRGESGQGLAVVLSGAVVVTRRDEHGRAVRVVTHGAGSFAGGVSWVCSGRNRRDSSIDSSKKEKRSTGSSSKDRV